LSLGIQDQSDYARCIYGAAVLNLYLWLKGAKRAEEEKTCNIALKKVKDSGRLNDWELLNKVQSRLGLKRFFRPTETIREGSFVRRHP
jgi:hypothetical protein